MMATVVAAAQSLPCLFQPENGDCFMMEKENRKKEGKRSEEGYFSTHIKQIKCSFTIVEGNQQKGSCFCRKLRHRICNWQQTASLQS